MRWKSASKLNGNKVVFYFRHTKRDIILNQFRLYMVSYNEVRWLRSRGGWLLWASTLHKLINFQQRPNGFDRFNNIALNLKIVGAILLNGSPHRVEDSWTFYNHRGWNRPGKHYREIDYWALNRLPRAILFFFLRRVRNFAI